jgi:alpha 1,2-mannosyltransferase
MKPVIVYLAQNTSKDAQYDRDSRRMLHKSLELLYKNYNDKYKHDVLIFHEGDFGEKDQADVACGRKEIKFKEIHFTLPAFLRQEEIPMRWNPEKGSLSYTIGYRHMIRFFAVQIFDILDKLGYDWCIRMDDDSFIHSQIDYDLFKFMEQGGYEYGYRVDIREAYISALGFGETVLAYIKSENITPSFFNEHLQPTPLQVQMKNIVKTLLMRMFPKRRYPLVPSFQYDLWGFYNNFFITKIAFWKSPEVRSFIDHFDRIGGWYKYRWGDHIFQSAVVQIFMTKEKIYKFTDWTYEHASIKQGKLFWGGIYEGNLDKNSEVVKEFKRTYGSTRKPAERSF